MKTIGKSPLLGVMAKKVAVGALQNYDNFIEFSLYRVPTGLVLCTSQGAGTTWDRQLAIGGLGAEVFGDLLVPFAQRHIEGCNPGQFHEIGKTIEASIGIKLTWEKE